MQVTWSLLGKHMGTSENSRFATVHMRKKPLYTDLSAAASIKTVVFRCARMMIVDKSHPVSGVLPTGWSWECV